MFIHNVHLGSHAGVQLHLPQMTFHAHKSSMDSKPLRKSPLNASYI